MKYCKKCGAQLPDEAQFCDKCGNVMNSEDSAWKSSVKIKKPIKINKKKAGIVFATALIIIAAVAAFAVFNYTKRYPSKINGIYASQTEDGILTILNMKEDGRFIHVYVYKDKDNILAHLSDPEEHRISGTYKTSKKKLTLKYDINNESYDYTMTDAGLELTGYDGITRLYNDVTDAAIGVKESQYEQADTLYASGNYKEAMATFESLDGYYDSISRAADCLQYVLKSSIKDVAVEAVSLSQTDVQHFTLMLKVTNNSDKRVDGITGTIEIRDNSNTVLASFNSEYLNVDIAAGASKTHELSLSIGDTAAVYSISQATATDIKLVFTVNSISFEGTQIECNNEVRELVIQDKPVYDSTTLGMGDQAQAGENIDNSTNMNTAAEQGMINAADTSTIPIESAAAGGNTYNITYNIPGNANTQIPGYEQQTGGDWSYILPDSDKRYLSAAELQGLSAYELRIARNEIYARYGRKFTDPALNSYFSGKAWYVPVVDADKFNDNVLTNIEKANLETIKRVEAIK